MDKELTLHDVANALRTGRILEARDENDRVFLRIQGLDGRFYRLGDTDTERDKATADDILRLLAIPYLRWFAAK